MMRYLNLRIRRFAAASERGMTMLEVTLILAALVALSAAVAPAVLRSLNSFNEKNVLAEMTALYDAITGTDDTFGYIGELGVVPATTDQLVRQAPTQPLFERSGETGIGYGWNGPYINTGRDTEDYALDPWGNVYFVLETGQIFSAGPNGIYEDEDDIIYPHDAMLLYGELLVKVMGHSGDSVEEDPSDCFVTISYAEEGEWNFVDDADAPFSFESVHRGLHEVIATCVAFSGDEIQAIGTARVRGGAGQQVFEVHVELGEPVEEESPSATGSDAAVSEGLSGAPSDGMEK